MFVNYVREINAFHRFANDNYLGSGERLLWFGLMDYINLHYASGAEWPDGLISIPNKGLLAHVPFGEDALTEARNRLKQRGLLEYTPGKRNKEAPKYRIHYFSEQLSTGFQQAVGTDCPEKPGNLPGKEGGNDPGNLPGKEGGNDPGNLPGRHPNLNLNVNGNQNVNPNVAPEDEEDAEEDYHTARTCEGWLSGLKEKQKPYREIDQIIEEQFSLSFGRKAMPSERNRLTAAFSHRGMEKELLREAIEMAAMNGARNPVPYIIQMLDEWEEEYIRTAADLGQWQFSMDMFKGKSPFGSIRYEDLIREREERRKRAEEAELKKAE